MFGRIVQAPRPAGSAAWPLLLAGLALAGCASGPTPHHASRPGPAVATIEVIARDWHADIALPVTALQPPLAALARRFPGASHLVIGFGDRGYWPRPTASPLDMLRALLPGPGAILVTGLRVSPAEAFGAANVVTLPLSQAGLDQVSRFLWEGLETGPEEVPRSVAAGPYPGSLFYASTRRYSFAYTCNTWSAEALRQAGIPVTVASVLLTSQVMAQARAAAEP
jgi:hypothetical protein